MNDEEWQGRVSCCVCLDCGKGKDASWVAMDCGHVFHTECIAQALEHKNQCPTCRHKQSRRQPLRLYVNNEQCLVPPGGGGTQLGSGDADYRQERKKFAAKLEENRHAAAQAALKHEETAQKLEATISKLAQKKAENSELKLQLKIANSGRIEAKERNAAKDTEIQILKHKAKEFEESVGQKIRAQKGEYERQLNLKESEIVRLKHEKKRGMLSSNLNLTYEQIIEMSHTSEEKEKRSSMDDLAKSLGVRNAQIRELQEELASLKKAKELDEAKASMDAAEHDRSSKAELAEVVTRLNEERYNVNRLECQLEAVQDELRDAKSQLAHQAALLEDALQSAAQQVLQQQQAKPRGGQLQLSDCRWKHSRPRQQQQLQQPEECVVGSVDSQSQRPILLPGAPGMGFGAQHGSMNGDDAVVDLSDSASLSGMRPVAGGGGGQGRGVDNGGDGCSRGVSHKGDGDSVADLDLLTMEHKDGDQQCELRSLDAQHSELPQQHLGLEHEEQLQGPQQQDLESPSWQLQQQSWSEDVQGNGSAGGGQGQVDEAGPNGLVNDESVLDLPQLPGRMLGVLGSRAQQQQKRLPQQQQQIVQGERSLSGLNCLQDVSNTLDSLQPTLPNLRNNTSPGEFSCLGERRPIAIPACSASGSLLGSNPHKPSFTNSSAKHGKGGPLNDRTNSGLIIREGPDGKGGVKRHMVATDMSAVPTRHNSGPSFIGTKMPHAQLPAKKHKPAGPGQSSMDKFLKRS